MAIQSSVLAWRIPWTEEPGRLLGFWFPDQGLNAPLTMKAPVLTTGLQGNFRNP